MIVNAVLEDKDRIIKQNGIKAEYSVKPEKILIFPICIFAAYFQTYLTMQLMHVLKLKIRVSVLSV